MLLTGKIPILIALLMLPLSCLSQDNVHVDNRPVKKYTPADYKKMLEERKQAEQKRDYNFYHKKRYRKRLKRHKEKGKRQVL